MLKEYLLMLCIGMPLVLGSVEAGVYMGKIVDSKESKIQPAPLPCICPYQGSGILKPAKGE